MFMKRLTNNSSEYLNQIKIELSDNGLSKDWKTEFQYLEMPYFLTYFEIN